jgi:PHD/YefM family antitoxin component YafN of YafNO toxin-antitoxin module
LTLWKNGGTVYGQGEIMPAIRPSADLVKNYNEISELCHEYSEPVFITKDGTGDLAVMSIETYELLLGRLELHSLINEGVRQAGSGKTKPLKEAIKSIRNKIR